MNGPGEILPAAAARFGEKTARTILASLERVRVYTGRWLAAEARPLAERLLAALRAGPGVVRSEIAGGLRYYENEGP